MAVGVDVPLPEAEARGEMAVAETAVLASAISVVLAAVAFSGGLVVPAAAAAAAESDVRVRRTGVGDGVATNFGCGVRIKRGGTNLIGLRSIKTPFAHTSSTLTPVSNPVC